MKKYFLLTLLLVASLSMSAQVFQMDASSHGLSNDEITDVEAGHLWGSIGDAIVISNPFTVGHRQSILYLNGYDQVIIDGHVVTSEGVQGQTNPKDATGGSTSASLLPPAEGSVSQIEAKKNGWVYIVARLIPHKAYMVFEDDLPIGYKVALTTDDERVPSGILNWELKGEGEYNRIPEDRPVNWLIREYTGDAEASSTGTTGLGVFYFPVRAGSKYYALANGSKIAWSGVCFSEQEAENVSLQGTGDSGEPISLDIVKPESGDANLGQTLYHQDFEGFSSPLDAGWVSPNAANAMSIVSGNEGSYYQFDLGNNNSRNSLLIWGADIYSNQEVSTYTVDFQWGFIKNSQSTTSPANTHYTSEVALLAQGQYRYLNNVQYAKADSMRLFSITQLKGTYSASNKYWTDNSDNTNNTRLFCVNNETSDSFELDEGAWYNISVTINTTERSLTWTISTLDGKLVKSGTSLISEKCDVYATALNVLLGRYSSIAGIDNVRISKPTSGDYANKPTIQLSRIYSSWRGYSISFEAGETLYVKMPDGQTLASQKSPFYCETETSGVLEAWTKAGSAFSEHASIEVSATNCKLPSAYYSIKSVGEGFKKVYQIHLDNSQVPLRPQMTFHYTFTDASGHVSEQSEEMLSGSFVEVTEQGVLSVTTVAEGYESATITISNDVEYTLSHSVDLQHMTEEQLLSKSFVEIDPLESDRMSGENNWTARQRLWYGIADGQADETGAPTYAKHVVYGPASTDGAEPIRRFEILPSKLTKDVATSIFAPVSTWYTGMDNPQITDGSDIGRMYFYLGIGLLQTGTAGDDGVTGTNISYQNAPVSFEGLDEDDLVMVYTISDYGSSSVHPLFPEGTSEEEATAQYKAMNLGDGLDPLNLTPDNIAVSCLHGNDIYSLYRIDTAITRVDVFKVKQPEPELEPVSQGDIVDFAQNEDINENTDLSATVVDNMYYSISSDAGGFDAESNCIVITKETSDEQMTELQDKGLSDGQFNSQFTGIVFKLPAGTGTVTVNAETTGNMLLKVKIGEAKPVEMSLSDKLKANIPYDIDEPTLIYIYAGNADATARTRAEGDASEQAGSLKIYGIEWVSEPLKGDANGDGVVNVADLVMMVNYMRDGAAEGLVLEGADTNRDQKVDQTDIEAVIARILKAKK